MCCFLSARWFRQKGSGMHHLLLRRNKGGRKRLNLTPRQGAEDRCARPRRLYLLKKSRVQSFVSALHATEAHAFFGSHERNLIRCAWPQVAGACFGFTLFPVLARRLQPGLTHSHAGSADRSALRTAERVACASFGCSWRVVASKLPLVCRCKAVEPR